MTTLVDAQLTAANRPSPCNSRAARRGPAPETIVLVLGAVGGLLMLAIVPPFQSPDEPSHFLRAYHVSEGGLLPDVVQGGVGGAALPKSLSDVAASFLDIPFHPELKASREMYLRSAEIELNPQSRATVAYTMVAVYSCVPYSPQAIGILGGRLAGCRPLTLLYLGRFTNLMAALGLFWLSVRITPVLKMVFGLIALMPMTLFLSASLSADALTLGLSLLVTALVLRTALADAGPVGARRIAALYSLFGLLALCKSVYVAFPLLLGLVPAERLGGWWRRGTLVVSGLLVSVSVSSLWSRAAIRYWPDPHVIRKGQRTSRQEQIDFVRQDPLRFGATCWRTVCLEAGAWRQQMVGVFGWLDTPLRRTLIDAYFVLLMVCSLTTDGAPFILACRDKAWILACILATAGLSFLALYLWWTPVGRETVWGIQGRYFIPILPLVCLLFNNRRIKLNPGPRLMHWCCTAAAATMLLASLRTILVRFYA